MSHSPTGKLAQIRRRSTPSTPTKDSPLLTPLVSSSPSTPPSNSKRVQPTPPPGRPGSSNSSRPGSRSGPGSVGSSSRGSIAPPDSLRVSRQNSLLSPITNDICYDELPDAAKYATTIGRYHTIVPPINRLSSGRPVSRSYSVMAETPLPQLAGSEEYGPEDDHAINTVTEENHPNADDSPRLSNPLADPRYLKTPVGDLLNNNSITDTFQLPTLPIEPSDKEPRLRLAVRLPSGARKERHFRPEETLQMVIDFASVEMAEDLSGYLLRSADKTYEDIDQTLTRCQIPDRTLLILVEPPD